MTTTAYLVGREAAEMTTTEPTEATRIAGAQYRLNIEKPGWQRVTAECAKCGGAGGSPTWPGFTCWRCGGKGQEPNGRRVYAYPLGWSDEQIAEHVQQRAAKAEARAAAKAAKEEAAYQEWLGTLTDEERAAVVGNGEPAPSSFVADIRRKARRYATLTERQLDALVSAVAQAEKDAAQAAIDEANKRPVPITDERVEIEGEVLAVKYKENEWGGTVKMLVGCDGYKLWGSRPSGLDVEIGDQIRFVARLTVSDDDESFGFFARPTGTAVLAKGDPRARSDQ